MHQTKSETFLPDGLSIRPAVKEDAPLIAQCVLAAVGLIDMSLPPEKENCKEFPVARRVCAEPDTLFSYNNAVIACIDGEDAGALVSYDGALYAKAREKTFRMFREELGNDNSGYAMETGPGEYYLDSIALRPEFRGHDMGLDILRDTILKARDKGFRRFTLIVDVDAPRKIAYYSRLGFKPGCTMETFGSTYLKMVLEYD